MKFALSKPSTLNPKPFPMNSKDFLTLVKASVFLGEARQKELTEAAEWMTAKEREFLSKKISETGVKIEENNAKMIEQLDKVEKALKDFQRKELPKLIKEQEGQEREEEEGKAAKMLKNY